MASIKRRRNQSVQFSTSLPINAGALHNYAVQRRTSKVHARVKVKNGRTEMRVPENYSTRFCECGCRIAL
jgi:hypothetical protein